MIINLRLLTVLLSCAPLLRVEALRNISLEDQDTVIVYAPPGAWNQISGSSLDHGGAHMLTDKPGATATFKFTGTAIYLISPRWPYTVKVGISLDYGPINPVDLDDSQPDAGGDPEIAGYTVAWMATELENVQHTLVVSVLNLQEQPYRIVNALRDIDPTPPSTSSQSSETSSSRASSSPDSSSSSTSSSSSSSSSPSSSSTTSEPSSTSSSPSSSSSGASESYSTSSSPSSSSPSSSSPSSSSPSSSSSSTSSSSSSSSSSTSSSSFSPSSTSPSSSSSSTSESSSSSSSSTLSSCSTSLSAISLSSPTSSSSSSPPSLIISLSTVADPSSALSPSTSSSSTMSSTSSSSPVPTSTIPPTLISSTVRNRNLAIGFGSGFGALALLFIFGIGWFCRRSRRGLPRAWSIDGSPPDGNSFIGSGNRHSQQYSQSHMIPRDTHLDGQSYGYPMEPLGGDTRRNSQYGSVGHMSPLSMSPQLPAQQLYGNIPPQSLSMSPPLPAQQLYYAFPQNQYPHRATSNPYVMLSPIAGSSLPPTTVSPQEPLLANSSSISVNAPAPPATDGPPRYSRAPASETAPRKHTLVLVGGSDGGDGT